MKKSNVFKLVGLSKPKSMTCATIDGRTTFWPRVEMSKMKFDELFDYLKNNWNGKQRVRIEHDGLYDSGAPENGLVTAFFEEL